MFMIKDSTYHAYQADVARDDIHRSLPGAIFVQIDDDWSMKMYVVWLTDRYHVPILTKISCTSRHAISKAEDLYTIFKHL